MKAFEYTQVHRLDAEPTGRYVAPVDREAALRDTLRGVDLGAHDEKIIKWAVSYMDDNGARTIVSWIERARLADRHASRYYREDYESASLREGVEGWGIIGRSVTR